MLKFTAATPIEDREQYWKDWLDNNQMLDEEDIYGRQVYKVVEAAYNYKQYSYNDDELEDTTKLIRVRLDFSVKEIKANFGIEAFYVMGSGVYLPMEGLLLSPGTRSRINYDRAVATVGSRGEYLKLDDIPQDVIDSHKWGLVIPALDGLFVPKRCPVTNWLYSSRALQYFDLQLN